MERGRALRYTSLIPYWSQKNRKCQDQSERQLVLTAGKLHLVSRCGTEKAHSGKTTHLHSKVCQISNRQHLKKHFMSTNMKAHNFKINFKFEPLIIICYCTNTTILILALYLICGRASISYFLLPSSFSFFFWLEFPGYFHLLHSAISTSESLC